MIANVFSPSRFPKLEHLTVEYFRANDQNLALLASTTANLKSVSFFSFEWDSKVSGFQSIADSNKPLKDVAISVYVSNEPDPSAESTLDRLSRLVQIFRKCRKLQFQMTGSAEDRVRRKDLMRIYKILACRDVHVFIRIGDVCFEYSK